MVEERNVDDLADKDEAEEEGGRAEDDGLEKGHGEERSAGGSEVGVCGASPGLSSGQES